MDRTAVRNHIKVMKNSSDLLNVLNLVKQEIAKENGEKFYPISYNSFCFYSAPRRTATYIIRKTKCFRILERNAKISKTKRNFSRLYPTPQKFKKIDRLRRNEIHLKAVRTSS